MDPARSIAEFYPFLRNNTTVSWTYRGHLLEQLGDSGA